MKNTLFCILFLTMVLLLVSACRDDDDQPSAPGDLENIAYNPQNYDLPRPPGFPKMYVPSDNQLTEAGVQLGRHLFFDPILSADSTMSCESCHKPRLAFTDGSAVSEGIDGITGKRSSMSLLNVGYFEKGLFWDGRSNTLEEQALLPVEDPIELHTTWPNVIAKFREHDDYPRMFRAAFGISDREEITKDLAAKALAQYQRSLVTAGAVFDKVKNKQGFFEEEELLGHDMYFDTNISTPEAECGHCHIDPLMTTNDYFNNGLDPSNDDLIFPDPGLGGVDGVKSNRGKFRAPSLRSIALTAPYMHDGRFATLEEVIDHYNSGGHYSPNRDPLMKEINLTEEEQDHLLAFLHTLTDTSYFDDPHFFSPFE